MTRNQRAIESLSVRGFDRSCILREGFVKVRCSQCEALFINGIAAHESGCRNATHECAGCNATVPLRVKYCDDCG